jgi:hypothetical protein
VQPKFIGGLEWWQLRHVLFYQGRITAKELVEAGLDVIPITDSASAAFIVDEHIYLSMLF